MSEDRRFPASPQHIERMRSRGMVPRSAEVTTAVLLALALAMLQTQGGEIIAAMRRAIVRATEAAGQAQHYGDAGSFIGLAGDLVVPLATPVVALAGVVTVGVIVSIVAQTGPLFAPAVLLPDIKRFDRRDRFGMRSLGMALGTIAKVLAVGGVLTAVLLARAPELLATGTMPLGPALVRVVDIMLEIAWKSLLAMAAIAVVDLVWTRKKYGDRMKMDRASFVRDMRELMPDAMVRGRAEANLIALLAELRATGEATGVVTNPTHYAVAFRYDLVVAPVPIIVAKGQGLKAQRIREVAESAGVPVMRVPALARALYRHGQVGKMVPPLVDREAGALWDALTGVIFEIYKLAPQRLGPAVRAQMAMVEQAAARHAANGRS